MSDFQLTVVKWAAIILLLAYLFHIDVIQIVQNAIHAAQTMHNSRG